jgi:hypothetical protein
MESNGIESSKLKRARVKLSMKQEYTAHRADSNNNSKYSNIIKFILLIIFALLQNRKPQFGRAYIHCRAKAS